MVDNPMVGSTKTASPIALAASNVTSKSTEDTTTFANVLDNEISAMSLESEETGHQSRTDEGLAQTVLENHNSSSSVTTLTVEMPATVHLRKGSSDRANERDQYAIGYSGIEAQHPALQDELLASTESLLSTLGASVFRRALSTSLHHLPSPGSEPTSSTHLLIHPSSHTETAKPEALFLHEDGVPTAATTLATVPLPESVPLSTVTSAGFSLPPVVQNSVSAPPPAVSIHTALYDNRWAIDFSQQIVVLTKSDIDSAYIRLNPAELGPVQVALNVVDGQASASFISQDDRVRAAIEAALGDLKEALAKNGVSLTNTYVGSQSNPEHHKDDEFRQKKNANFPDEQVAPPRTLSGNVKSMGIDVFA